MAFLCREGFIVNPPTRKASAKVQSISLGINLSQTLQFFYNHILSSVNILEDVIVENVKVCDILSTQDLKLLQGKEGEVQNNLGSLLFDINEAWQCFLIPGLIYIN